MTRNPIAKALRAKGHKIVPDKRKKFTAKEAAAAIEFYDRPVAPDPKLKPYPNWVCHDCAHEAGGSMPEGHVATFHEGICEVCLTEQIVTQPRDYRYPKFPRHGI